MDHFSPDFLSEIKTQLEEQLVRTERQLAELLNAGNDSAFPNYGEGEDENAEEVATYGTNLQLIDSLQSEVRDAKEALVRIQKGTYGICKYCKQQIDEQRLKARPTSASCIACKKALTQEI